MRSLMTPRRFLIGLVLIAGGCGGDDGGGPDAGVVDAAPIAGDFAGTWVMTSMTVPVEGTLVTLLRDAEPRGLRGDAVFVATGASAGTLDVRQVVLEDGLIASEVWLTLADVTVEPGRWVVSEPAGKVTVFTTALAGDHLVLTLDPADPRTTAVDPPRTIVVDRVTPWTTTVVGAWDLVSMQLPDGTVTAGACTEVQPGSAWAVVTMDIAFSARLMFERSMTMTGYSDAACTVVTGTQTSVQTGYAEEEGGTVLRLWGREGDTREHLRFDLAVTGDAATLTRTACRPLPACEGETPLVVNVRRAASAPAR